MTMRLRGLWEEEGKKKTLHHFHHGCGSMPPIFFFPVSSSPIWRRRTAVRSTCRRPALKMKCCRNTLSFPVTRVRKTAPPHLARFFHSFFCARRRSSCPAADCGCVLSAGLHQFQRQRSVRDPVPSAVRLQPNLLPAGAQPQGQVHLRRLLRQEMPT